MTINGLYYMCDNLGPSSTFIVYIGKEVAFRCRYMGVPHPWDEKPVRGFKVVNDTDVEVYF